MDLTPNQSVPLTLAQSTILFSQVQFMLFTKMNTAVSSHWLLASCRNLNTRCCRMSCRYVRGIDQTAPSKGNSCCASMGRCWGYLQKDNCCKLVSRCLLKIGVCPFAEGAGCSWKGRWFWCEMKLPLMHGWGSLKCRGCQVQVSFSVHFSAEWHVGCCRGWTPAILLMLHTHRLQGDWHTCASHVCYMTAYKQFNSVQDFMT